MEADSYISIYASECKAKVKGTVIEFGFVRGIDLALPDGRIIARCSGSDEYTFHASPIKTVRREANSSGFVHATLDL